VGTMEKLNENNFILYCMRNYDNPQCHSIDEFEEDLKRFLYLKKLLSRYVKNDDLKDRLILNHIIVLHNVFGDSTLNILFHKIDKECWRALITFLVYLNRMPDAVPEYGIVLSDVVLDEKIIATLRKI
jgi:hypothetical protein